MGPGGEGAIRGSSRSAQLDGKWAKTRKGYGWVLIKGGIQQMMSCHEDAVWQHDPGNRRYEMAAAGVEGSKPHHLWAVTRAGSPSN